MMQVKLGARATIPFRFVKVSSLAEASDVVRKFIDENDCTAGCGTDFNMFLGGDVLVDGEKVARVSYNGRVWM